MVLTRSQRSERTTQIASSSASSSSPSSCPSSCDDKSGRDKDGLFKKSKITKAKSQARTKSNVSPTPDPGTVDSTWSVDKGEDAVDKGEDAIALATNDEVAENMQDELVKGKQSKKSKRKRKLTVLTVENESKSSGNSSENGEAIESSSTSSEHSKQQKTAKIVEKQDATWEKPQLTPSVTDELQKENVNTSVKEFEVETKNVEEEKVDAKLSLPVNAKEVLQLYKKESYVVGQAAKPKGKPKSGRHWKTEQTTRFSGMKQNRPLKTSWQKKMQQKADMKNMKMFEAELKEAKNDELERKKKHRAKKIKRKLENERKSEIVQVISNPAKLKRMKKKQLRKVEMRSMPDSSKKQIFKS